MLKNYAKNFSEDPRWDELVKYCRDPKFSKVLNDDLFEIQNELYERFPNCDVFISKSLEKEYLNSVIFNTAELLTELGTNEKIMEEREAVLDSIFEDRNNLNAMIQESYEAEKDAFYKSFVFSTDKFRSLIEDVIKLYDELEKSLGA